MTPAHALVLSLAQRWLSDLLPPSIRQELAGDFAAAEDALARHPAAAAWLENTRLLQHWEDVLEDPQPDPAIADALRQALFDGRQVEIVYRKGEATRQARLHPFGWIQRNGTNYLACTFWDFADPLWLSVHRVQTVTPLNESACPPLAPAEQAAFLERSPVPATATPGASMRLELEFHAGIYESIRARPPRGVQRIDPPADGWFRLLAEVPDTLQLRWWLLGFNEQVRILQPESLKLELQGLLFDRLTGLINRHEFERVLQRRLAETRRTRQPLSLLMVDLDHFKQVNDTFGHGGGDQALTHAAHCLRDTCRAMDLAARYGGEEFVVLLPNTTSVEAVEIAERIRHTLERTPLTLKDGGSLHLTASLGVASEPGPPDSPLDIVQRADVALYRAKGGGRNRVCADGEP